MTRPAEKATSPRPYVMVFFLFLDLSLNGETDWLVYQDLIFDGQNISQWGNKVTL